jgi:hypothetical protein
MVAALMATSRRARELGNHPRIPRGMPTLPPLPSLQQPLPVLSPDLPKAKPKRSKPAKGASRLP